MENIYPDILPGVRERLAGYGDRLAAGGDRLGLVSRGDLPRLFRRHLREASAPELTRLIPEGARVVDVGSGGGLPGIPVAVLRPDVTMSLLEPRRRKADFLERTILELGLPTVRVLPLTLEEAARLSRAPWRTALSRGFAWTPVLVAALESVMEPDGELLRFGALDPGRPGVDVRPLGGDDPRGVQRWPRGTWAGLPGAR